MDTAIEHSLSDHPKSPSFMDSSSFSSYEPFGPVDYLNGGYPPNSPFGISSIGLDHSGSPGFSSLNLPSSMGEYHHHYSTSPSYTTAPAIPTRPYTPTDNGVYPPVLSNLSAGEMSSDGMTSGRRSRGSGTHSPPLTHTHPSALSAIPRSHRYNPLGAAVVTRSSPRERKRRNTKSDEFASDDEDDADFHPATTSSPDVRREEIRRQRIESEQRRRDELRDGYRRLKDALPVSNQKSSKVSLLDRATTHLKYLEMTQQQLQTRLQQAEAETQRLRQVNEALMLGTAEQRAAAAAASLATQQAQAPATAGF